MDAGQQVIGNDHRTLAEVHGRYVRPGEQDGTHYVTSALDGTGPEILARWVSANPDLSGMAGLTEPDEYGRTHPWAVYARYAGKPEYSARNQSAASAVAMAERLASEGARVHVSLDTCG